MQQIDKHTKDGYDVVCVKYGQEKAYGDTVNEYTVRDVTGERTEAEIRRYCTTEVCRADDPKGFPLYMHLRGFYKVADGKWRYTCGHYYTG